MYRAFGEGRVPRRHRSALLDRVRPAPKHSKLDLLGESLLAQLRKGTSKHFGCLHRVFARKAERLECRWCTKKCVGYAWLRKHTVQKHAEKQLLSGAAETLDAPEKDGEAGQKERGRRNVYASSAIASSRARRGSPRTSAKQPLS
ncbi:hypothetical protein ERJ75_000120900 [Trypanosoma vivax]|nr:hypothetical protein ERJ75_001587800 [Trypanosoma vivax]KAH8619829.1 hypothetical protein ERJ75_000120900 [Trypanosoma vivax]